jgi:signal transduction histidine kinase
VNINWKVEPSSSEVDRSIAIAAGEVIEEAMGNAIRHGKATVIEIELLVTEPAIKITVTDNGKLDEDVSARLIGGGTGLSMVDIRSSGKWSIERRDESTVLQAMLTLPPSQGLNP